MLNDKEKSDGFFEKLRNRLTKTRKKLVSSVDKIFLGERVIDDDLFEEIEEILITADVGPAFTYDLIEEMKERVKRKELDNPDALRSVLRGNMTDILKNSEAPLNIPGKRPFPIVVVGVNGTGKTTTIGKIAHHFKKNGQSVMLVAADTFRAAAIEQLEIWSQRVGVPLIKQKMGADPSAVVYDAIYAAKSRGTDIVIIDTAGRLHTKINLMEELGKTKRIIERELPGYPCEVLLVLDSTTGQNAISQVRIFNEEIGVTGIVLTKLDGTAKGGIIIRIAKEFNIPIRYIGIGEGLDDLRSFDSEEFINALF
jgi:fused signal recognition particle receptor